MHKVWSSSAGLNSASGNSSAFTKFLENLTGIEGLIPDPHFRGGGLHQVERGGYLDIHCDFNVYEKLNLDRRLNVLIYLNKDWKKEYGGDLELWDKNMTKAVARISPIFNRFVVFATDDYSYHGHPDPLKCPEDKTRKSLALYYYTNGRPSDEVSESHTTLFQHRPGLVDIKKMKLRTMVKKITPPIVFDLIKLIKRRLK